jgi:precorrin-3B C17-methyltransferase
MTPAVSKALQSATDLVGYDTYLARVPEIEGQRRHASGNRVEIDRSLHALELASQGRDVVVVSGGDPGVFAMAAAVFEAIETGDRRWRDLDVRVEPGVTAMLAAGAAVGAPLGGDFCVMSLSDNLKTWDLIERRLEAAARGDFVIALYNPASRARPHQLSEAFAALRRWKPGETVVAFVKAAGTEHVEQRITTLAEAHLVEADMRTLVFIGASTTRVIERDAKEPWIYTPRSERALG